MTPYRSPIARIAHVRCGYGGSGPAPAWYCAVMPDFDVTAIRAIRAFRMTEFVVEGVAHANAPIELRIWLPGLDCDHNEITKPFSGSIDAGATLRLRGKTVLTPLPPPFNVWNHPYRAALIADDEQVELTGVLDSPWPTG